jgi:Holliday junction DNA helicase RuvA
MISLLKGTVAEKDGNRITMMTAGGVGYAVAASPATAAGFRIGDEATLHTYLKVSEDALDLYGFADASERAFFSLLLTVSGVGPKTAMNILGLGSIDRIRSAIARGDVAYLTGVSGLGKKTAERLVVELKAKIGKGVSDHGSDGSDILVEVIDALVGMGYDRSSAKAAIEGLEQMADTTEALLKLALRRMK